MRAVILGLLCLVPCVFSSGHLDVLYQWRTVDFEFPDQQSRERSIRNKDFIPGTNVLPLDVDIWYNADDRTIFTTFPKFQKGIPATLATVSDKKNGDFHLVRPYPDWSWHSQRDCEKMISVFRTQIDKCGRLWVIDSGMVDLSLETSRRQCQPKLLAFHLNNKRLAGKHIFPSKLLREHSILTNVAVDVRDANAQCVDTFAYVSDTTGYSLLVFDARKNKSWKVASNSMYPYPPYGFFQTNNVEFNLMDGILGTALSPLDRGDRKLFYHSLASVRESWVAVSVLRNENNFSPLQNYASKDFHTSEEARKSQSVVQAFDSNGILYFGMVGDNSLSCWNYQKPFVREHLHEITRDNFNLQFAAGLKVIPNEDDEEEIWIMTNRFQLAMVDGLNATEVNFRIIRGKIEELTRGKNSGTNDSRLSNTFVAATMGMVSQTNHFDANETFFDGEFAKETWEGSKWLSETVNKSSDDAVRPLFRYSTPSWRQNYHSKKAMGALGGKCS